MVIQQKHHGWGQMGGCTTAMMDWHHIRTNPFTLQAISAEELRPFSAEISMRELLPLVLVALLVLGIFHLRFQIFNLNFSFLFSFSPKTETFTAKCFCLRVITSSGLLLPILVFLKNLFFVLGTCSEIDLMLLNY